MRLTDPPARVLIDTAFAREVGDSGILYFGMSLADLAHVLELIEIRVVKPEIGGELLAALLELHPAPPLDFGLDPARGDLFSNREAYLRMLGAPAGWLSAGRARREATTIGYRVAVRSRLLSLAGALGEVAAAALELAHAQRATLFPDYTYLQPAQPTTFGHYLLTFAAPVLRDLDRLRAAFARTNASPAGMGSVNGSRLALDRARLAGRLGFDSVIPHARDAMWQPDGPIEIGALLAAALVNLDRLAEDLQLFATAEFGLVELADRHTRTSVIMPQKKNPYALAYVRGVCGEAIGAAAAFAALGKTPSGQIDNRLFAYGDVPRALTAAIGAAQLMADVLRGLRVHAAVAARRAGDSFTGATDLAEMLMLERGLDYKTAHDLVGRAVREALQAGQPAFTAVSLEAAAEAALGHPLDLSAEWVLAATDPARIVAARTGAGGAAEPALAALIVDFRQKLAEHMAWREATSARLAMAERALVMEAVRARVLPGPAAAPLVNESAPTVPARPQSLEDFVDELPQPARRRRHYE
jgi:argininosuccinate lyase